MNAPQQVNLTKQRLAEIGQTLDERLMDRYLTLAAQSFGRLVTHLADRLEGLDAGGGLAELLGKLSTSQNAFLQNKASVANLYAQIGSIIPSLRNLCNSTEGDSGGRPNDTQATLSKLANKLRLVLDATEEVIHGIERRGTELSSLSFIDSTEDYSSTDELELRLDDEALYDDDDDDGISIGGSMLDVLLDDSNFLEKYSRNKFDALRRINSLFSPDCYEEGPQRVYDILEALRGTDLCLSEDGDNRSLTSGADYKSVGTIALAIDLVRRFQQDISEWPGFTVPELQSLLMSPSDRPSGISEEVWLAWQMQAYPRTIDVEPSSDGIQVSFVLPLSATNDSRIADLIQTLTTSLKDVTETTLATFSIGESVRFTYSAKVPGLSETPGSPTSLPKQPRRSDHQGSAVFSLKQSKSQFTIVVDRQLLEDGESPPIIAAQLEPVCLIARKVGGTAIEFYRDKMRGCKAARIVPQVSRSTAIEGSAVAVGALSGIFDRLETRARVGPAVKLPRSDIGFGDPYLNLPFTMLEHDGFPTIILEILEVARIGFFDLTDIWLFSRKKRDGGAKLMTSLLREVQSLRDKLSSSDGARGAIALAITEDSSLFSPNIRRVRLAFTDERQDLLAAAELIAESRGAMTSTIQHIMPSNVTTGFFDHIVSFLDRHSQGQLWDARALMTHLEKSGYVIDTQLGYALERAQQLQASPLTRDQVNRVVLDTIMLPEANYVIRPDQPGEKLVITGALSVQRRRIET